MKNRTFLIQVESVNRTYLSIPGIRTTPSFFFPSILTIIGFQNGRDEGILFLPLPAAR